MSKSQLLAFYLDLLRSNPSTLGAWIRVWLDLVLQSEYNFYLSLSRPLLPKFEYTFCLNPSRPYFRERERVCVCGQLLIRSILFGLAIQFWSCPEKIIKKSCSKKNIKRKRKKTSNNKKGALCVFSFCFYGGALWLPLCPGSRLMHSLA
jgi:hypothetical protein